MFFFFSRERDWRKGRRDGERRRVGVGTWLSLYHWCLSDHSVFIKLSITMHVLVPSVPPQRTAQLERNKLGSDQAGGLRRVRAAFCSNTVSGLKVAASRAWSPRQLPRSAVCWEAEVEEEGYSGILATCPWNNIARCIAIHNIYTFYLNFFFLKFFESIK